MVSNVICSVFSDILLEDDFEEVSSMGQIRTGQYVLGAVNQDVETERWVPPVETKIVYVKRRRQFFHRKCGEQVWLAYEVIDLPHGAREAKFLCNNCGGYLTITVLKPQK